MNNSIVKVYFIGAGPGDPELITVKGKRIVEEADIIIYAGSLVNRRVLEYAKDSAQFFDSAGMNLDEVLKVIDDNRKSSSIIARVHSGDPSIYGAIQEQIEWCEKQGISYEVIPGVSSLFGASASLHQELTLPGVSQTVIVTRISGRTKVPSRESIREISKIGATLVIFLSINRIEDVVKDLLNGYAKNTPAAVVYRATWPEEMIIRGTLEDIADKVKAESIDRQALIFVGDVLNRRGFELSKLYHKDFTHSLREAKSE